MNALRSLDSKLAVKFKDGSQIGLAQIAAGVNFQCKSCKYIDNGTCRNSHPKLNGRKVQPVWCCNLFDYPGMKVIV